jgi:hypothetical protein
MAPGCGAGRFHHHQYALSRFPVTVAR